MSRKSCNISLIMSKYYTHLSWGAVEISCARNGITIHGYDNFEPLVEFWQCLFHDPKRLANLVREYYLLEKERFYQLQQYHSPSKYTRAAIFFVINRCSFSGSTMRGGMSPGHPRFTESSIERLEQFRCSNMTVQLADFNQSMGTMWNDDFIYLDPPYKDQPVRV